jgi:hypothetical protein
MMNKLKSKINIRSVLIFSIVGLFVTGAVIIFWPHIPINKKAAKNDFVVLANYQNKNNHFNQKLESQLIASNNNAYRTIVIKKEANKNKVGEFVKKAIKNENLEKGVIVVGEDLNQDFIHADIYINQIEKFNFHNPKKHTRFNKVYYSKHVHR